MFHYVLRDFVDTSTEKKTNFFIKKNTSEDASMKPRGQNSQFGDV